MNRTIRCAHCRCLVLSNPRVTTQRFCSNKAGQRARKAQWQRDKLATDPITGRTNATANTTGNTSIPIPGASSAQSVRITANATGFYNNTGTTNAIAVRLQRWTC